jgi:hypothetical protein
VAPGIGCPVLSSITVPLIPDVWAWIEFKQKKKIKPKRNVIFELIINILIDETKIFELGL